jgi:hypothetical protein
MTRDSGWVTGAIVMQFLWAFVLLMLPAYLHFAYTFIGDFE